MTETENNCAHCGKPLLALTWENESITHMLVCNDASCPLFASPQGIVRRAGLYLPPFHMPHKQTGISFPTTRGGVVPTDAPTGY